LSPSAQLSTFEQIPSPFSWMSFYGWFLKGNWQQYCSNMLSISHLSSMLSVIYFIVMNSAMAPDWYQYLYCLTDYSALLSRLRPRLENQSWEHVMLEAAWAASEWLSPTHKLWTWSYYWFWFMHCLTRRQSTSWEVSLVTTDICWCMICGRFICAPPPPESWTSPSEISDLSESEGPLKGSPEDSVHREVCN